MIVTSVQIKTVKMQKHLYCPVFTSKGYKKDVAPETPDFIGGFAVSTAEKTASDFVDVKKILFPF